MHFFPTKKTEFVSDWLFRVSLLVVRNWVRPTFRDPETFLKTTVLYILKDRNDAGWSPAGHCMVCDVLFRNTVGCIDSVHLNGYPTSFPGSSPMPGYFVHFGRLPVRLVGNHGVIGRWPCNLHPFPVSFRKARKRVKQNYQKENKQTKSYSKH